VFNSNESFLFVFHDRDARDTIKEILTSNAPKIIEMHLDVITKMWMNGYLSNYDYLIYLNRFSSRSFNDISQYPVFPWIIHEFGDDEFKLNSKSYYRDLSRPIGAINKHRMQLIRKNFEKQQRDKCQKHPPHFFNSFYSTPGYIIYFYMRAIPELILKLQNGPFGPSERIFKGLESLWLNIQNTGCNLTELIPEFYTPNKADFLMNTFRLDLGYTQEGDEIDDVHLPRWAEDMQDFMFYMRAALESDFTSVNLHKWIDLTWGCKQQGEEAQTAENVYYHLCYEKNIAWENYKVASADQNPFHKRSLEIQISEYGQAPLQLFDHPHPKKKIKIPASMAQHSLKKPSDLSPLFEQGRQPAGAGLNVAAAHQFKKKQATGLIADEPLAPVEFSELMDSRQQSQQPEELSGFDDRSEIRGYSRLTRSEYFINQDSQLDKNNESDNGLAQDFLKGFPDQPHPNH